MGKGDHSEIIRLCVPMEWALLVWGEAADTHRETPPATLKEAGR